MSEEEKKVQSAAEQPAKAEEPKKKKKHKMPHMLWLMLIILLICSVLTYIIPAGQFATDADGNIIGDQFSFLGYQTPVNPIEALMQIFPGLTGSALIVMSVMVGGATIQIFLDTKTFDHLLDWAIYKTSGKGDTLLITILFCLMVYLGGFGGSDALIAIVPVGLAFARKMNLDGMVGMMVTTFATLIGFGTGPTKMMIVQVMMGTRPYGAFGSRFIFMNIFMIAGLFMVLRYVKMIRKDPTKSPLYENGWRPGQGADETIELKETTLGAKTIITLIIFVGQYIYIVWAGLQGLAYADLFAVQTTVFLICSTIMGLVNGMSWDDMGNSFVKGLQGMAFVGFIIGMARSISLVLGMGNVLHTIVYAITRPLMNLPRWISSVGMMLVIALINPIIPSASSKAAILVPIIAPIGEVLGLEGELIVQAYQFGDGFTNIISPVLGWTIGSLATCGIDYPKWFKWAFPRVLILLAIASVIMVILTVTGWTGAF